MSAFEIELGERTHCRELNSGKYYTGIFLMDDRTISADLYGYGEALQVDAEKPIFIQTAKGKVISLFENICGPGTLSTPQLTIHTQHIISHVAIIGPDPWPRDDLIKTVCFTINNAKHLLRHNEKVKELSKHEKSDASHLFSVCAKNMTVRVGYSARYSFEFDDPREYWPEFEVEFNDGVSLFEYLEHVACIVQLFAAAAGVHLRPSKIRIFRFTRNELLAAVEKNQFFGVHSANYIWPEIVVDKHDLWAGHSFIHSLNDSDLAALEVCLITWVERCSEWKRANDLMMQSLSLRGEIGTDRLLTACRWFEEIPIAKSTSAIVDEHVQIISQCASDKAVELGYSHLKSRVAGVLKRINAETHYERFTRLVSSVTSKFGSVFDNAILEHLMRAIEFRGKSAHGHFSPDNDAEFRLFAKAIFAMEALCFLLTVRDLPLSDDGVRRAGASPIIQSYRHSY